jgi:hypothetical protein
MEKKYWWFGGAAAIILGLLIFHAGLIVGFHDAQHRGKGFVPGGHGAVGIITAIALPSVTLQTRDGGTTTILVASSTPILRASDELSPSALAVGDAVIVIGDPNDTDDAGAVDARLVRIMPEAPPMSTTTADTNN